VELLGLVLETTCESLVPVMQRLVETRILPAMKQQPKHSKILAKMEPRIAAWMTWTFSLPIDLLRSTMNKIISTTDPKVVSITTAMDF
jgi:PhoPQ-activated pathogenicity-related protein